MTDNFSSTLQLILAQGHRIADEQSLSQLRQIAQSLRDEENYFAAAYAMESAFHAAWGYPDQMQQCLIQRVGDLQQIYSGMNPCSPEALTAAFMLGQLYQHEAQYLEESIKNTQRAEQFFDELAQRLVTCFSESPQRDNYLVRGVIVAADLAGAFDIEFPEYEVDSSFRDGRNGRILFRLPSAFTLLRRIGDYQLAERIAQLCPNAFSSPGLRGWKAAIAGFVDPDSSAERFAEAADAFAEDTQVESQQELQRRGGSWSGINTQTWAPYFRARSLLAMAAKEPERIRELIADAAQVADPEAGGYGAPNVRRLGILVQALASLLDHQGTVDVQTAQEQFRLLNRLGESDSGDDLTIRFLSLASDAFAGFASDPEKEITSGRLKDALGLLRRLPMVEPALADAIGPELGKVALNRALGPIQTWMHRTLESIQDERQLQRIIYRLSQASLPLYAQILHGPLEYGKDVVVYLERDGSRVLRMYQAKVGDVSLSDWRSVRSQLEDMFLVPLPDFIVPTDPEPTREGVLICNGHASANAQPSMDGWFDTQKAQLARDITFIDLDGIVRWIIDFRLVNEFRMVLRELNISVAISS